MNDNIFIEQLIAALLPAAVLLMLVVMRDKHREPASQLIKAILLGVAIVIPVIATEFAAQFAGTILGLGTDSLMGALYTSFIGAALPEEAFKLLALWLLLRKNRHFDEHYDGIVYAVCISMGFAAVENVSYIVGTDEWMSTALSRGIFAVPGHYAFAILMGYYFSVYCFINHSRHTAISILLAPVVAHGIYDAILFSAQINPMIEAASSLLLLWFCYKVQTVAHQRVLWLMNADNSATPPRIDNL